MNKTELLALCESLGIVADASMTIDALNALVKGYVPPVKRSAADAAIKGVATVVGFHYIKGLCSISLSNGVSGIVGDATTFPFSVMLTLKGTHANVRYTYLKDKTINDKVYRTYALEWSLE